MHARRVAKRHEASIFGLYFRRGRGYLGRIGTNLPCSLRLDGLLLRTSGKGETRPAGAMSVDERVRIRTLVVEDIQFQRDMLKTLFTSSNVSNARGKGGVTYDVTFADGGREAQRLLTEEKKQYDLILVDVLMPGVTGDKLLTKLGLPPTVAVVMISVRPRAATHIPGGFSHRVHHSLTVSTSTQRLEVRRLVDHHFFPTGL